MSLPLIQIRDAVCRISSSKTLRLDSFSIAVGEHWCFFGGNGSGKSLLAKLLQGKLRSGHAHVHYQDGFDPRWDIIVVSFEEQQRLWEQDNRHDVSEFNDSALDQGTTVEMLILDGAKPDAQHARLLNDLAITSIQHKGIRFLSSGQVRKALIARALYQNPRLLILDDPLESIDRDSRKRIADVIRQWRSSSNSSIVLSRRSEDILPDVTHIALLDNLSIAEQGSFSAVKDSLIYDALFNKRPLPPEHIPDPCKSFPERHLDVDIPLIELINVNAFWQSQQVLKNVSWSMCPGHHTLIEGPNGCGKSTLLSLIDGENHKAYGQQVKLFGRQRGSGETVWDIKARFGVVSNELHNRYIKGWKVVDVVVSGFFDSVGLYDDSGASERRTAEQWLQTLDIAELGRDYYHELSFGQQRLVLLARAMVKRPSILILDEPCVGLDDWHRELILGTLDVIAASTRTQLIYVSHTAGEHPACINQRLRFVPLESAYGYQLEIEDFRQRMATRI
jgi:molybdate transport system ATP-binding protein